MKFFNGTNRNQLPIFASSIDDAIAQDNEIRLIDLFVDSIKLADFDSLSILSKTEDPLTILRIYSNSLFMSHFGTKSMICKSFYGLICLNNHKATFAERILIVV